MLKRKLEAALGKPSRSAAMQSKTPSFKPNSEKRVNQFKTEISITRMSPDISFLVKG